MDASVRTSSPKRAGVGTYIAVFLVLAAITAVEVGLSYFDLARELKTPLFLGLSLAKAALVAAFYMHLRQEPRVYAIIFLVPVPLVLLFAVLMVVAQPGTAAMTAWLRKHDPLAAAPILVRVPTTAVDQLLLTKPLITVLLLVTTLAGMVAGAGRWPDGGLVLWTVLGGALSAAGASDLS